MLQFLVVPKMFVPRWQWGIVIVLIGKMDDGSYFDPKSGLIYMITLHLKKHLKNILIIKN